MASEQTFFCEDESASHMTTYDRVPVLVTTVDISPGVSVTLSVYPGDDPCAVAQAFCAQHNLADSVVGPLTDHIEENLREEESIDEGIDEGGTPPLEGDVPPQAARGSDVPVGSKSMGSSAPSNSDPLMNRANESVAEVAAAANPAWEKHKHPATRTFQALRIRVNQELDDLDVVLGKVIDLLAVGGRLVVISFHSLEDRRVKHFMRSEARGQQIPRGVPIRGDELGQRLQLVGKATRASKREQSDNPRARSAIMRVAERIA